VRGDFAELPDKPEPGEDLEGVVGDIDFPPEEALASGSHVMVVIVMPALAESEDGEEPIVLAGVGSFVATRAEQVRE